MMVEGSWGGFTDRLVVWRETNVVDGPLVTGKFVKKFSRLRVPNDDTSIARSRGDLLTLWIPTCANKILLQTNGGTVEGQNLARSRGEWTNIPSSNCRVMRVGEKGLGIRGNL